MLLGLEKLFRFADVMLPSRKGGKRVWQMIEVKSSTGVKDYHRDDAAIQAYIARSSGVSLGVTDSRPPGACLDSSICWEILTK